MDKKSIVFNELDNHLRHLFEYKFFNKFYNAVEIICRYTVVVTVLSVISGTYIYSYTEDYTNISYLDIFKIIVGLSFLIISMSIIIREITILCYGKIYGDGFKKYISVSEEDVNNTIDQMKRRGYDEDVIKKIEKVVGKYKYKENGIYVLFTDGINKKVIKELVKIELNYRTTQNHLKKQKEKMQEKKDL